MAQKHGITLYESVRDTLADAYLTDPPTNPPGEHAELAVDGVLLIAEHGDYPATRLGQEMTPRRYLMEQIFAIMQECGQVGTPLPRTTAGRAAAQSALLTWTALWCWQAVPVYNDKHLAYRPADADWCVDTAAALGVPLWAASAMPLVWRGPAAAAAALEGAEAGSETVSEAAVAATRMPGLLCLVVPSRMPGLLCLEMLLAVHRGELSWSLRPGDGGGGGGQPHGRALRLPRTADTAGPVLLLPPH